MKRKLISICFVTTLVVGLMPNISFAQEIQNVEDIQGVQMEEVTEDAVLDMVGTSEEENRESILNADDSVEMSIEETMQEEMYTGSSDETLYGDSSNWISAKKKSSQFTNSTEKYLSKFCSRKFFEDFSLIDRSLEDNNDKIMKVTHITNSSVLKFNFVEEGISKDDIMGIVIGWRWRNFRDDTQDRDYIVSFENSKYTNGKISPENSVFGHNTENLDWVVPAGWYLSGGSDEPAVNKVYSIDTVYSNGVNIYDYIKSDHYVNSDDAMDNLYFVTIVYADKSFTVIPFLYGDYTNSSFEFIDAPAETASDVTVAYHTHIQKNGWEQVWKKNGEMSGTSGESKRLEGIEIKVSGNDNLGIEYRTHVQTYGWQDWKSDGVMSGTTGESKRLEAIAIRLTGADKDKYDVYYRVHAQSYGWLGWAKNGQNAGTAGQAKRLEGIQIQVLPKGQKPSEGSVGYSYIELGKSAKNTSSSGMVNYMTHVQSYGDQSYVYDGSVSGTFGEAKRLEGICINVNNSLTGVNGGITYRTHVQKYGWLGWSSNGDFNGTHGESKRLEAIEIKLTGEMEQQYDIYYRVHSQTYGWLGWAKNGETAGTSGLSKRLEGIQIVLMPKGSTAPNYLPGNAGMTSYIKK